MTKPENEMPEESKDSLSEEELARVDGGIATGVLGKQIGKPTPVHTGGVQPLNSPLLNTPDIWKKTHNSGGGLP